MWRINPIKLLRFSDNEIVRTIGIAMIVVVCTYVSFDIVRMLIYTIVDVIALL